MIDLFLFCRGRGPHLRHDTTGVKSRYGGGQGRHAGGRLADMCKFGSPIHGLVAREQLVESACTGSRVRSDDFRGIGSDPPAHELMISRQGTAAGACAKKQVAITEGTTSSEIDSFCSLILIVGKT